MEGEEDVSFATAVARQEEEESQNRALASKEWSRVSSKGLALPSLGLIPESQSVEGEEGQKREGEEASPISFLTCNPGFLPFIYISPSHPAVPPCSFFLFPSISVCVLSLLFFCGKERDVAGRNFQTRGRVDEK